MRRLWGLVTPVKDSLSISVRIGSPTGFEATGRFGPLTTDPPGLAAHNGVVALTLPMDSTFFMTPGSADED